MSQEMICPTCGIAFCDEDYCPRDGTRLVLHSATSQAVPPAQPAAEEGSGQARDSKLARFMDRLGLRRVADKAELDRDEPAPTASAEMPSPLPTEVLEKGWQLAGPVHSSASVDRWPVEWPSENGTVVAGQFHRFRTGALTTDATYRRLEAGITSRLARVWAHGTVNFGGARADYELVSLPKAGVGLDRWLLDSTPSEQRAVHLWPALVELLQRLASSDVCPLVFEPAQLMLTEDGELWLGTAAVLTDRPAANEYRPELARSSLLPRGWTAPELTDQNVLSANAAVFSLGQILAQAIWGQPCSPDELQRGAVAFQSIVDARLARMLMGCLWPRSLGRWTLTDLLRALASESAEAMPAVAPWATLTPGASATSFSFAGASFWRLEDLLATATKPAHWREATARIEDILAWAKDTAWKGQVQLMREALGRGRSADWALIALARVVRPEAPMSWCGLDLTDAEAAQSLAGLAQRALAGDVEDVAVMRELFAADLRGAFARMLPRP